MSSNVDELEAAFQALTEHVVTLHEEREALTERVLTLEADLDRLKGRARLLILALTKRAFERPPSSPQTHPQ